MNATDFYQPHYRYPGVKVDAVPDGDNLTIRLPLPLDVSYKARLRMIGYDAPEMDGPDRDRAEAARAYLESLVAGRLVYVETYKERRSFIRYTAHAWVDHNGTGDLASVSVLMLASGLVVPWP